MVQRHENRRDRGGVIYYYYYYYYYYYFKKAYWKRSKLIKFVNNFDRFTRKVRKVVCKVHMHPLLKIYFLGNITHTNFIFVKYSFLDVAKLSQH